MNKLKDELDDELHVQQEIPAINLAMEEDYIKKMRLVISLVLPQVSQH